MEMPPNAGDVWFVLGPSGAGKTTFSNLAAERNRWIHYDIDQSGHDGIDHYGLRCEWDSFLHTAKSLALINTIRERLRCCKGAILSFPSMALTSQQIEDLRNQRVKVIFLYGTKEFCKASFLERERNNGRNLPEEHWIGCNSNLYDYADKHKDVYDKIKFAVFKENGERILFDDLYNEVMRRPI